MEPATLLLIGAGLYLMAKRRATGDRQLTENFWLSELTVTSTGLDNTPSSAEVANLQKLAERVLQPIRDHYGVPVRVTSAFRSEAVNDAVGGSPTSYHRKGKAADIYVDGETNDSVATWLYGEDSIPLDEVVVEHHTGHLHLSMGASSPGEREFLQTFDGKEYSQWKP